ncbi:hypothetical protein INT47_003139 [Mucor saturninus]|uniref:Integrase catalytic domain-containing protein n=1 Tax=Mucor saturninus TaxID=64648 RepID=A0A8H7QDM4_9FUNG|nr:hypothetical protein INT47_003139 [Mucor saturninus]
MDFPYYIALYNYVRLKTYPVEATPSVKAGIRAKSKKVVQEDGREYYGRQLLHEGTIEEVVLKVHNEGHVGVNNTWNKVHLQYVGKGLRDVVKELVESCITCQARRRIRNKKVNPGYLVPTPSRPFYLVGCDCVGPLAETRSGMKYIIVAVDYLTKWPIAKAVKEISAETTAKFIQDEIVAVYGVPAHLITDRGSNYLSEYLSTYLKSIECNQRFSTSRRPQSNGQVERLNNTLVQTMANLRRDGNSQPWDKYIQAALLTIRTMYVVVWYEMRTPTTWVPPRYDYVLGHVEEEISRRAKEIETWLAEVRETAKANADEKKKARKLIYDRTVVEGELFKVGDKVLMKDHYPAEKFADKFIGPLEVVKVNAATRTYYLVGPHSTRLKEAVNGDILVHFKESKRMIPDIQVERAMIKFQSWSAAQL